MHNKHVTACGTFSTNRSKVAIRPTADIASQSIGLSNIYFGREGDIPTDRYSRF